MLRPVAMIRRITIRKTPSMCGSRATQVILAASVFAALFSVVPDAIAGVVIDGTRVVYPASKREVTINVRNSSDKPSLVEAWLDAGNPDPPLPGGLVQDPAQFGVDLLAGGERASRSTPPITLRSVVTVSWVSRPKMTSATPLSTKAASAFRPGPRECRRAAGCRGGSLVSMSSTSTNTGSNCVLFTLPGWTPGCGVPGRRTGGPIRIPVRSTLRRRYP